MPSGKHIRNAPSSTVLVNNLPFRLGLVGSSLRPEVALLNQRINFDNWGSFYKAIFASKGLGNIGKTWVMKLLFGKLLKTTFQLIMDLFAVALA